MVFSVIITYGVYFASSMLALDPYHLVTCFAQYILLTPMYINVLNMYVCAILTLIFLTFSRYPYSYAFANLDDVSCSHAVRSTLSDNLRLDFLGYQARPCRHE